MEASRFSVQGDQSRAIEGSPGNDVMSQNRQD